MGGFFRGMDGEEMAEPLKEMFNKAAVAWLAERLVAAAPDFPAAKFTRAIVADLPTLELIARVDRIALEMRRHLPEDFRRAVKIVAKALGDPPPAGDGTDFGSFRVLPCHRFVAQAGLDHPDHALAYFRDFIANSLDHRAPTESEAAALRDLDVRLAALPEDAGAEAIQNEVYETGKAHYGKEQLRDWFKVLYETLLGTAQAVGMHDLGGEALVLRCRHKNLRLFCFGGSACKAGDQRWRALMPPPPSGKSVQPLIRIHVRSIKTVRAELVEALRGASTSSA